MSRADKTQTAITYELLLDDQDTQLREMKMTVLCAMKPEGAGAAKLGPYVRRHVAFMLAWKFSGQDQGQKLTPPQETLKLLR